MSDFEDSIARAKVNNAAIREVARDANAAALGHLRQYVVNRRKSFEAHERMDPHSPQTQVARRMLSEAEQELEAFAASIGEPSSAPKNEEQNS